MNFRKPKKSYGEAKPSNLSRAEVEDYADKVGTALKFHPDKDFQQVFPLLGGRLHYEDMSTWTRESGSIFIHGQCDFDIVLASYTSPRRDRFTIAHELGHYFLHSNQGEISIVAKRLGTGRVEWEANWFAAALLMPAKSFTEEFEKNSDVARLAVIFGVSRDAAEIRKKVLAL